MNIENTKWGNGITITHENLVFHIYAELVHTQDIIRGDYYLDNDTQDVKLSVTVEEKYKT